MKNSETTQHLVTSRRDELVLPPMARASRSTRRFPTTYKHQVHLQRRGYTVPFDYHLSATYRCIGKLDNDAFRNALLLVIARHEALYATYGRSNSSFFLEVPDEPPHAVSIVRDYASTHDNALAILRQRHLEAFDLTTGPFLRATIVDTSDNEFMLQITVDHFVCDGASYAIVLDEFSRAYAAIIAGETVDLGPRPFQLSDYSSWQESVLDGPVAQAMLDEWARILKPLKDEAKGGSVSLRTAAARSASVRHPLPSEFKSSLRAAARSERVTPFALAASELASLLAEDAPTATPVFNTPLSARPLANQQGIVGDLVSVLPIALRPDAAGTVPSRSAMTLLASMMTLQTTPFLILSEAVSREPQRYVSLADRLFFAFSQPIDLTLPNVNCVVVPGSSGDAITKGSLWIETSDSGNSLVMLYDQDRFPDNEVESFLTRYASRLTRINGSEQVSAA